MNTSVKAIFKDETIKEFSSIEEASQETGISIAAIKIRCNKPGSGGKDKTMFSWIDEHTARHYRAKKSKQKGGSFELEVAKKLREIGYEGCVSSRSQDKRADANKIDIVDINNELPINIQAKYTQNLPNYFEISNSCTDKSKPFCLAWKKVGKNGENSPGTVMIVPIEYFYNLIKK